MGLAAAVTSVFTAKGTQLRFIVFLRALDIYYAFQFYPKFSKNILQMATQQNVKCVVVGDGAVGNCFLSPHRTSKSTFVSRLSTCHAKSKPMLREKKKIEEKKEKQDQIGLERSAN